SELRLRDIGVWRMPLGRPGALGPRGCTPSAPGRPTGLSHNFLLIDAVYAGGRGHRRYGSAASRGVRYLPRRMAKRLWRRISPLARRLGPPAATLWLQHRRSARGASHHGRDDALPFCDARVNQTITM